MKEFADLSAVFQVGVRRTAPPPSSLLAGLEDAPPEQRALSHAGAYELMRRAGANPIPGIDPIPIAPEEQFEPAMRSADVLSEAFGAGSVAAILEWAAKAREKGRVAPPTMLVPLLNMVGQHRNALLPVLGERGRWLDALQNGDSGEPEPNDQSSESLADPIAYREWLAAQYEGLDWRERASALAKLAATLSPDDEPLLESALADRRKEVRTQALDLLGAMPNSRVFRQLSELARPLIAVEKGLLRRGLAVNPPDPEALPKWLPRTASRLNFGPKALALFDVVRYVHPHTWTFEIDPPQLFDWVGKTEYSAALLDGFLEAAIRYRAQLWIDTFFETPPSRLNENQEYWADICRMASPAVFDRAILSRLGGSDSVAVSAVSALSNRKRQLSLEISQAVAQAMQKRANLHYSVRDLAPILHPSAVELFEKPFGDDTYREGSREHIRKTLDLRRRLLASLDD